MWVNNCFSVFLFLEEGQLVKGGPGATVESTICNQNVSGSSPSLCTHLCGKVLVLKTILPQTPRSAGSLRHWVLPFLEEGQRGSP